MITKLEYFHIQHTLFAMSDKRKYIKNPYAGKKRKAWNKQTNPSPNKWKRKLAKSDKGSYYKQGKRIIEHAYGKGRYYNEYYDDDLDLVTTDKNSCSGESEAVHIITLYRTKCFFAKEKNILVVSLEKLSTILNIFTVCKFCNNPIQVEEDNDKSVGLGCFLKKVCQNDKCLKSKIKSSVNMSNIYGQFFEINYLCRFVGTAGKKK